MPPLPRGERPDLGATPVGREIEVERGEVEVVVIGAGRSGKAAADEAVAAGRVVRVLDAAVGEEVVAIYPGPTVVARTPPGYATRRCGRDRDRDRDRGDPAGQPGNDLAGLLTADAAEPPAHGGG